MATHFVFRTVIGFKVIIHMFLKPVCAKKWVANLLIDNISAYHRFFMSYLCFGEGIVIPVQQCFGCIKWSSVYKEIFSQTELLKLRVVIPDAFCSVCFCHHTQCLVPHLKQNKQACWCLTLRMIIFNQLLIKPFQSFFLHRSVIEWILQLLVIFHPNTQRGIVFFFFLHI